MSGLGVLTLKQFQFETLRASNHTACRFAEKTRFFRLASGRAALCRRLAFSPFSKVKGSIRTLFLSALRKGCPPKPPQTRFILEDDQ